MTVTLSIVAAGALLVGCSLLWDFYQRPPDPPRRFVPLVERVHKPWQKVAVILSGLALCVVISAVVDRVLAP